MTGSQLIRAYLVLNGLTQIRSANANHYTRFETIFHAAYGIQPEARCKTCGKTDFFYMGRLVCNKPLGGEYQTLGNGYCTGEMDVLPTPEEYEIPADVLCFAKINNHNPILIQPMQLTLNLQGNL